MKKCHLYFLTITLSMLVSYVSRTLVNLLYELECWVMALLIPRVDELTTYSTEGALSRVQDLLGPLPRV